MLAIIGGSGLYRIDGLVRIEKHEITTPFGPPSAGTVRGEYHGVECLFLPRHGEQHQYLPSEINYRANIWALKSLGARRILSVSAVGSLRESIQPGDLSLPHQYFDFTRGLRERTFFGKGMVAHVAMAQPTCTALASDVLRAAEILSLPLHTKITYACIEGPRFGTRAESLFLRNANCDLVGMSNVPEVFLAREAQLSYCTIAITTDYDGWQDDPAQHVNMSQAMQMYRENIAKVTLLLSQLLSQPLSEPPDYCRHSLKNAVLTPESTLNPAQRALLTLLKQ
ncbi:MAG: S-methyl-5'-thioadenosine phosphorylase [Gammaproteobacteria bacterium]